MSYVGTPNQADFLASFVRGVMGIGTDVLPDSSQVIPIAYGVAIQTVNLQLTQVGVPSGPFDSPPGSVPSIYALAVYNLAGDNLINYAMDVPPSTYFADLRTLWNINAFVPGVVQSAADVSTSTTLVVQKAAENFTLSDLQNLKTPYGRRYLSIAQKVGTNWGLT